MNGKRGSSAATFGMHGREMHFSTATAWITRPACLTETQQCCWCCLLYTGIITYNADIKAELFYDNFNVWNILASPELSIQKKRKKSGWYYCARNINFSAVHPKLWQLKCAFSSSTRRVVCSEEHRTKESRLQYWGLEDRENSAHSQWQLALQTAVYSYSIIT